MSTARGRSAAVSVLAAAVAARVSASVPLDPASARVAADPGAALDRAGDGWSSAGTLGTATAQGLRELPLAAYHWLGAQVRLPAEVLVGGLRVAVVVLAVLGAVRVARTVSGRDSWVPWAGAVLYGCGPVLVATLLGSPLDGLAVAVLPWVLIPVLKGRRGWAAAAASTAWVGLAGMAHPLWAGTVLATGLLVVLVRARHEPAETGRWAVMAAIASAWWLAAAVWEIGRAPDGADLLAPTSFLAGLREALGLPGAGSPWVVLAGAGLVLLPLAALGLRVPGLPRSSVVLLVAGVLGLVLWGGGWALPPLSLAPASSPPALLAPPLAVLAVAALLAWSSLAHHLLDGVRAQRADRGLPSVRAAAVLVVGVVVAVTSSAGFVAAAQEPEPVEERAPDLWAAVRTWSQDAPPGRVLVAPARAGRGSPALASALAGRPWVARDSLAASGAAATSAVDDVLWRLARGHGGPGTADALRRLGVSYVLLRTDGPPADDRARPSALLREALEESGAVRTAVLTAGSPVPVFTTTVVDLGVRSTLPQAEVWALDPTGEAAIYEDSPLVVAGDTASVADLAEAGLAQHRALRLTDGQAGSGAAVVSDSARRREVDQRLAVDPLGRDLVAGERRHAVPGAAGTPLTAVRALSGARAVSASSSAADVGETWQRASSDAAAAVDGNVFTAWVSRADRTTGEWWQLDLDEATDLSDAVVQFIGNPVTGFPVARVRVETDGESVERSVPGNGELDLDLREPATTLRITVTETLDDAGPRAAVGITELSVPDLDVQSHHVVDAEPGAGWVLATRYGSSDRCVPATPAPGAPPRASTRVCNGGLAVEGLDTGDLRREIVSAGDELDGVVWARAVGGADSAELADRLASPSVTATGSSVAVADLEARPQSAADGDVSTAWRPATTDAQPALTLGWRREATISGLRLVAPEDNRWSRPTEVRVEALGADLTPQGTPHEGVVAVDGSIAFPGVRTRFLRITVLADNGVTSTDAFASSRARVPVAVAEVRLVGGPRLRYRADLEQELECGSGPSVSVAGETVRTAVTTSARAVAEGAATPARFCAPADPPAGPVAVVVPATFSWAPVVTVLRRAAADGADELLPVADPRRRQDIRVTSLLRPRERQSTSVERRSTRPGVLALAVPTDPGWTARADGEPLKAVVLDGWAQGWLVPAAAGDVDFRYSPGDRLSLGVGVGVLLWLSALGTVALTGVVRRRRARHAG